MRFTEINLFVVYVAAVEGATTLRCFLPYRQR